jgi:hypothetical protein
MKEFYLNYKYEIFKIIEADDMLSNAMHWHEENQPIELYRKRALFNGRIKEAFELKIK